jgi:hypothetical protein
MRGSAGLEHSRQGCRGSRHLGDRQWLIDLQHRGSAVAWLAMVRKLDNWISQGKGTISGASCGGTTCLGGKC